jgi:hypothetical protein
LVFPPVTGTILDRSNVEGAPITIVSRRLGRRDPSVTLRVYAHWLPDASTAKHVDALDDASPRVPRRHRLTGATTIRFP